MADSGFYRLAAAEPDRVAIVDPDHRPHTAGELLEMAHRLTHGLRALGLGEEDVVAVVAPNCVEYVATLLSVLQSGWHLVTINHHLNPGEVAYIVEDSGARAFIGHAALAELAAGTRARTALPDDAYLAIGGLDGFRDLAEFVAQQPATEPQDRVAGGLMNYTSGTTGRPKGVRRPLPGLDADTQAELFGFLNFLFGIEGRDNVHLTVAPLYHTAVMNFTQAALHHGHQVVLMDKWTPEGTLERIERYRVTTTHMVPTMFHRMLKLPEDERRRYDVLSLTHVIHSAAPCPIPTKRAMLDWLGPVIYEYYAATEGGGTLATPADWERKPGTVGTAWPISEVKVLDDDGSELPPGQIGTVWMKMGDRRFTYHGDDDKTRRTWNEQGFFTVGDAGELDEDGFLFLRDRKVDMIISGGVNIYPAEIESVLIQHPKVADVAVFGIPNDDWGEEVKAAVELVEDVDAGPDLERELLEHCAQELARYKCPRSIDVVSDFPRDPNGKVYKRTLRDPYWAGRESALV
ncbi:MAG: acyl-CoA synthetase [Actinobacteria bacterium]|nr:acyl-CoA synthetase [Actinomycetota bacterium]